MATEAEAEARCVPFGLRTKARPPTIRLGGKGALPRTRRALRLAITVLSVVLVWGVLVAPDRIFQLTPAAFARIPVEGLVLVAVAVVLPPWPRRIAAAVAGILFGLLTLVKILNAAFYLEIGQALNPVFGWLDLPGRHRGHPPR